MENASKALIITGSMLLMILVVTFSIRIFTKISGNTAEYYEQMSDDKIAEINQKFLNYETKKELTIQDVVSIVHLAREYNDSGELPVVITVTSPGGIFEGLQKGKDLLNYHITEKKLIELMQKNVENKYKCTVSYAENSKLVGNVYIEKYEE